MLTIFSNEFISIHHYPETAILSIDWTGKQTEESVKDGCMRMLQIMQDLETYNILNDNLQVVGDWNIAAPWVGRVWFPLMVQAGMQKFAWVHSVSRVSRLSTQMSVSFTDLKRVPVKTFLDHESAILWLMES